MKDIKRLVVFAFLLWAVLTPAQVKARESTAYTYTISVDGEWIRTQDAYIPGQVYLKGFGMSKPSDLFIKDNIIYIADTGNGRIVVFNPQSNEVSSLAEGVLKGPRGIFVHDNGNIYVADYDAESVFVLSRDGTVEMEISRPDSYLFSEDSRFKPTNVAVTKAGIIYVVGEGSYEGIMQFNQEGEFQGYYAANTARMTLLEKIQELIFTQEQLNRLFKRTPRAIQNIDITDNDLIYSVTQDANVSYSWREAEESEGNNVKLHNLAGQDILSSGNDMMDEWNFVDIAEGQYDNCYALTYTGLINEYDNEGNLIFSFGGRAVSSERNGLFTYAAAIDLDDNGFIYVLDSEMALIQMFYPTEYAVLTHKAISELQSGNYLESEATWAALLKLNGMSRIAHNGYGKTLYLQQNYKEAMKHFRIANNKAYYSESFWEIRDAWINKYIGLVLIILAAVYVGRMLWKHFYKRKDKKVQKVRNESKLLEDILYVFNFIRHPIDSFYYVKRGQKGSVLSASLLYLITFVLFMCDRLFRGFIFNHSSPKNLSILSVMALFFIPCFLWVIGNYMVSSIEGEGKLRTVYVGTAYAMTPYIILTPFVLILTYVLTLNEAFYINFIWYFSLAWSGVLIFLGIIEIHNYTFKDAIKNVLITLFFMAMAITAFAVLYIIWGHVIDFINQVVGEVMYRALY